MICKNCNKTLKNSQKFCDECGAKVIQNRLTPKILATQVNEQFISIDNKFFRTFIDLFRKPDEVINGYINGTRKKYIDVLQYFAIALTLAGIQVFLMSTSFKDSLEFQNSFMEGFNASSAKTDNPFANINFNDFLKYQGLIYILTVPFYALGTWLTYYLIGERIYNFTEHLVLNLYFSAQTIIITSVFSILFLMLGIDYLIVSTILTIPYFAYLFYILKSIFKLSLWDTFLRFLLVMFIYVGSTLVIGLFIFILGVIFAIAIHK